MRRATTQSFPVQRLKYIVDPERPITYGIVQCGPDYPQGVPYIRPADMTDEGGVEDLSLLLRADPKIAAAYARSTIARGDLVISIGPSFGKVMVVPAGLAGANLTQGTARIAVQHPSNARFIFWALRSSTSFQHWESSVGGATFRALNLGPLTATPVPLPDPETQRAIADYLDRETARLDALVTAKERVLRLLAEKRQVIISSVVTRGLDSRANFRDSGIPWLGKIPAHWNVIPLMWLTQPDRPIMYGIVLPGPDVDEGIPILKGGNVRPSRMNLASVARTTPEIEAPYVRARLRANDLVYSIRGSIGDCEIVPGELEGCNITQDVARVAPRSDVDARWLLYTLLCTPIREELAAGSVGATIRGINIFDLKRVRIPTPPPAEQAVLARYLSEALDRVDRLASATEQTVALIKERRAALIAAAVTGQIDVESTA